MDVDKEGDVTDGVKLSMFDISDKKNVKEEHKYTLKDVYSTDVEWDYKAALIDVEKNIIGFPAGGENRQMYYLFSYTAVSYTHLWQEPYIYVQRRSATWKI